MACSTAMCTRETCGCSRTAASRCSTSASSANCPRRGARSLREVGFGAHLDVSDELMGAQLAMVLQPLLSAPLAELNLNELMDALLDMGQQWGVVGPEELILFGKQLGYFERYLVALAPDLVLGGDPELLRNIVTREISATA